MNNPFGPYLIICFMTFIVSSMLSMGASLTVHEIIRPIRNFRLLIRSLLVSFVFVPLLAFILAHVFLLDMPLKIGLILFGLAAGSEALPNIVHRVGGDRAFAVALMILQIVITMVVVPLAVFFASPEVEISLWALLLKIFVIVLLPLIIGLIIKAYWDSFALRLHRVLHILSTLFAFVSVIYILIFGYEKVSILFGSGALLAGLVFFSIAAVIGYFFGGPSQETRKVLSIGSCGRNGGISLLIATQAYSDPGVALMVFVMIIIMTTFFLLMLFILGRRHG